MVGCGRRSFVALFFQLAEDFLYAEYGYFCICHRTGCTNMMSCNIFAVTSYMLIWPFLPSFFIVRLRMERNVKLIYIFVCENATQIVAMFETLNFRIKHSFKKWLALCAHKTLHVFGYFFLIFLFELKLIIELETFHTTYWKIFEMAGSFLLLDPQTEPMRTKSYIFI